DGVSPVERNFNALWNMAHNPEVIEQILQNALASQNAAKMSKQIIHFKADLAKNTISTSRARRAQ
ncbi:hypothetical protein, partial [Vibrio vulnificus]|uniref:hypothetical protein n=1 Tax=Vibrio vulnificus TaxID=672 RepID=UPI00058064D6